VFSAASLYDCTVCDFNVTEGLSGKHACMIVLQLKYNKAQPDLLLALYLAFWLPLSSSLELFSYGGGRNFFF